MSWWTISRFKVKDFILEGSETYLLHQVESSSSPISSSRVTPLLAGRRGMMVPRYPLLLSGRNSMDPEPMGPRRYVRFIRIMKSLTLSFVSLLPLRRVSVWVPWSWTK